MKGVLITGASGGIGRALCAAFRSGGWRVVATDAPERGTPEGSGTEGTIWVPCCLAAYVADAGVRDGFRTRVVEALGDVPLVALGTTRLCSTAGRLRRWCLRSGRRH